MACFRKLMLNEQISPKEIVQYIQTGKLDDGEKTRICEEQSDNVADIVPEFTNLMRNYTLSHLNLLDPQTSPEKQPSKLHVRPQNGRSSTAEGAFKPKKPAFPLEQRSSNSRPAGGSVSVNLECRLSQVKKNNKLHSSSSPVPSRKNHSQSASSFDGYTTDTSVSASWEESLLSNNGSSDVGVSPIPGRPRVSRETFSEPSPIAGGPCSSREVFSEPRAQSTPQASHGKRNGKNGRSTVQLLDFISNATERNGKKKKKKKGKRQDHDSSATCETSNDSSSVSQLSFVSNNKEFPSLSSSRPGWESCTAGGGASPSPYPGNTSASWHSDPGQRRTFSTSSQHEMPPPGSGPRVEHMRAITKTFPGLEQAQRPNPEWPIVGHEVKPTAKQMASKPKRVITRMLKMISPEEAEKGPFGYTVDAGKFPMSASVESSTPVRSVSFQRTPFSSHVPGQNWPATPQQTLAQPLQQQSGSVTDSAKAYQQFDSQMFDHFRRVTPTYSHEQYLGSEVPGGENCPPSARQLEAAAECGDADSIQQSTSPASTCIASPRRSPLDVRSPAKLPTGHDSTAHSLENSGFESPQKSTTDVNLNQVTTPVRPLRSSEEEPQLEKVTHKEQLDLYIEFFSELCNAHLITSLSSEIYFIVQLLVSSSGSSDLPTDDVDLTKSIEDRNYFYSFHNIVYFAAGVLSNLKELVMKFDQDILRFLIENDRLKTFCPELHKELKEEIDSLDASSDKVFRDNNQSILTNPFQHQINLMDSFPSTESFQRVKKLRDNFPELLKMWDKWHTTLGWHLDVRQVQALCDNADLSFYMYFSRMFVAQLFQTCQQEQTGVVDYTLGSISPDKSMKLTERLEEGESKGPSPSPTFPGRQQFLREVLDRANNALLNQHVKEVLVTQIHELNSMRFELNTSGRDKDEYSFDDKETEAERKRFRSCMLTLRTFGKFLGYVTFSPYYKSHKLPFKVQADCMAQRQLTPLPLDLVGYLDWAWADDHLALTVPWVAEFLAMMDGVAHGTRPIIPVLVTLKHLLKLMGSGLKESGYPFDRLLIVISLGWLFDQPSLLGYFLSADPPMSKKSGPLPRLRDELPPMEKLGELVPRDLFYVCCPYFGNISNLLNQYSKGDTVASHARRVNPRPPAPSSTPKRVDLKKEEEAKAVQLNLIETALRFTFPRKLHTAMEALAEVLCEHCATYLTRQILAPSIAQTIRRHFAMNEVPVVARELYTNLVKKVDNEAKIFNEKMTVMMQLLLPFDELPSIRQMVGEISMVYLRKQLHDWLNSGVSHKSIHKKLESEITKKCADLKRKGMMTTDDFLFGDTGDDDDEDPPPTPTVDLAALLPADLFDRDRLADAGKTQQASEESAADATAESSYDKSTFLTECSNIGGKPLFQLPFNFASWCRRTGILTEEEITQHLTGSGAGEESMGPQGDIGDTASECAPCDLQGAASDAQSSGQALEDRTDHRAVPCAACQQASGDGGTTENSGSDTHEVTKTGSDHLRVRPVQGVAKQPHSSSGGVPPESDTNTSEEAITDTTRDSVAVTCTCNKAKSVMMTKAAVDDGAMCMTTTAKAKDSPTPLASVGLSCIGDAGMEEGSDKDSHIRPPSPSVGGGDGGGASLSPNSVQLDKKLAAGVQVYISRETQDIMADFNVFNRQVHPYVLRTLLQRTIELLESKSEMSTCVLPAMIESFDNLTVAIIFRQPSLWTEEVQTLFLHIWRLTEADECSFSLLCQAVLGLDYLDTGLDVWMSLHLFVSLLVTLVREKMTTVDVLRLDIDAALSSGHEWEHEKYMEKILQGLEQIAES